MMKEKVILAYSGGLDTSVILKWLVLRGYDVVAYVADVGQQDDLAQVRQKALNTGASKAYVEDLKEEFVRHYIFPQSRRTRFTKGVTCWNVDREAADRQEADRDRGGGKRPVRRARRHGQGNDQVRFELSYYALKPGIK